MWNLSSTDIPRPSGSKTNRQYTFLFYFSEFRREQAIYGTPSFLIVSTVCTNHNNIRQYHPGTPVLSLWQTTVILNHRNPHLDMTARILKTNCKILIFINRQPVVRKIFSRNLPSTRIWNYGTKNGRKPSAFTATYFLTRMH